MRRKDLKYYSEETGARRPASRYLYLGEAQPFAVTWIMGGVKFMISFRTMRECHKFMRNNCHKFIGLLLNIERKHVSRLKNKSYIMDYETQSPAFDHYTGLPDDMRQTKIGKVKEFELNKKKRIAKLNADKDKLTCRKYDATSSNEKMVIEGEIKWIDRQILEICKEGFDLDLVENSPIIKPKIDLNNIDQVLDRMTKLEKKAMLTDEEKAELVELNAAYNIWEDS